MPALAINSHGIAAVEIFSTFLQELLDRAETAKPTRALEPALSKSDFDDIYSRVHEIFADLQDGGAKKFRQFAIIETAARDVFGSLIATTSIDSPDFVRVWNLFDILSILSDNAECDPPLLFWLIEELLDSQTISGCRKVFDYLESRRERITAKHFNSTKLVILRSCNDLLRRLSRAEDTPFCGRVFIFLFQVFPLGDKSSVNLRGEYHVENVTTYDETPAKAAEDGDKMEVDGAADGKPADGKPADGKAAEADTKTAAAASNKGIDFDALYPVFWSLQTSFSQPKSLFNAAQFKQFKKGLEESLAAFRKMHNEHGARGSRQMDDAKRGIKRKREKEDDLADTYNPKYLTSRDLFELETSDLTFRRHFMLQALIITEFLLSLSAQAKEKLASANVQNKSVLYQDQVLSEEDTVWAIKMKHSITEHIKSSNPDGPYFLRMVDTILARDKNWVRWKIESCPSIERPGVSSEDFVGSEEGAQKAFGARRRRHHSLAAGSFSLDFLNGDDSQSAKDVLEQLKQPERFALPEPVFYKREIADEDFEIEMPDSEHSKVLAESRKASKTWRALRIVRQSKLAAFDKIDDDNKIDAVFAENDGTDGAHGGGATGDDDPAAANGGDDDTVNRDSLPNDTRPVVLASPSGAGQAAALAKMLISRNPGVFTLVTEHTTKPKPEDGGDQGAKDYHYVDSKAFNVLLDGDKFIGFSEAEPEGAMYGTHKGLVDTVADTGKVPLVLMHDASVQAAKDNAFAARYVSVALADASEDGGSLFDKVVVAEADGDAEAACKKLEAYIYELEGEEEDKGEKQSPAAAKEADKAPEAEDTAMEDAGGEDANKAADEEAEKKEEAA